MTLLTSAGRAGDTVIYMYIRQVALSVISFRRAVICDLSQITEKVIDYESRLFCTECLSFNWIALVFKDEKRASSSILVTTQCLSRDY